MKRAIVALALVGTLLLSVVTCQIYNPADNSTLYTAMRTEGAISWADYSKKFEKADGDTKYGILMEYETFRKLETNTDYEWTNKASWIALYEPLQKVYEEAKKAVEDAEKAIKDAGDKASDSQKKALTEAETELAKATEPLTKIYGSVIGLKILWDKEFKVLYDFNGKL